MGLLSRWLGPPTRPAFARLMAEAVRAAGDDRPTTFDAERFCLSVNGEETNTLFLYNAYRDYCAATRSERRNVLRQYASISNLGDNGGDAEPSYDAVRPQLLPRVRDRFYYAVLDLQIRTERAKRPDPSHKPPLDTFLFRTIADALTLEVVIDYPTAIRSLARGTFDSWGMAFDDVMAAARQNLWRLSNADFQQVRPGLFVSPWRDTHDASRLALHDLIWQLPVRGRHVAAVPNRNVLLVTGEDDPDNLIAMAELARHVLAEPRPMTGTVFRLDGTAWQPFLPPPQSPAHWPLRRLAMESTARDYHEQASLLETLHRTGIQDVFVAQQQLMRNGDSAYHTWTSWVDGVSDALMPVADAVGFAAIQGGSAVPHGFAQWTSVLATCGSRMEPTDLYPPRYRIRSFPRADELRAMNLQPQPI